MNIKTGKVLNVLVVDDSAFMRKVISDILNSDNELKVIDIAKNGLEAVEKAKILNPDVITLDVEMPVMNGLSCLKELLKVDSFPVVMLSSVTKEGAEATIQALGDGAVDFITKPVNIFDMSSNDKKVELVEKVKLAGKIVKKHIEKKKTVIDNLHIKPNKEFTKSNNIEKVVAIGTSTGGPRALQSVIPFISGDIPAAVLIVQHMPPGFTKSLAARLDSMSEITVKEAEDGEILKAGFAYLAPGDYHMLIAKDNMGNLKIELSQSPPVGGHRPSVDVMMESLSRTGEKNLVGVIMTGMGGDGSKGLEKIKNENKGYIIAQDEKSCVVYGMPKVAIQSGVVDEIVPLKDISKQIMKIVGVRK